MAVSKRLRFEILRRDDHTCRYCGAKAPDVPLRVDHVIPVALGGSDDPSNLVTACEPCNTGKASIGPDAPLVAEVAADALRWARAMAIVAEQREAKRSADAEIHDKFLAKWNSWTYTRGIKQYTIPLPGEWRVKVTRFIANGLELNDLTELVDVAMSARCDDVWRYFCGCCWRRLTEAQELAREILDLEGGTDGG
ncbi:HNH endonuclease [Mycobacterium intracellulare]|uniref:HNH endonuclease n=1 Tax=Mycobacterium intracellulare TaxID=1767 RepID=A0AAE4U4J5_MYCIT|nr:HNH endonuclease [Mycobacterium intracellulare]MDV6979627.1 HNH endonuclease [Mycobacterium intracellulare]MDV6985130.1 HNH endonuclease [Mycobacterium intracellulare]MDV7014250.1 HNH endonuclease [Mycobacterium intracellulare]MDV7030121.1 HNH endonuclease [Mycobacterium intracellulare]